MNIEPEQNEKEISILDIIKTVQSNIFKIVGFSVIIGVLTAGLSLQIENIYESTAALIIRKPEIPITGEPSPLDISMVQSLAESHEIKKQVYDQLNVKKMIEDVNYNDFQKWFKTSVQKEISRDLSLQPMIRLTAETTDPLLSKDVVNAWSDFVTSQTKATYLKGVNDLENFTSQIYKKNNENLIATENKLTSAILEAELNVKMFELENLNVLYTNILEDYSELESVIQTTDTLIQETERFLKDIEIDGIWIGEFYRNFKELGDSVSNSKEIKPTTNTALIISTIDNLLRNEMELSDFEESSQLQYLEFQLINKEKQLQTVSAGITQTDNDLVNREAIYESYVKDLQKLDPKIKLKQGISSELSYEGMAKEFVEKFKDLPILEQEVLNTNFQNIQSQMLKSGGEISGLKKRLDYFIEEQAKLKIEVSVLAKDISLKTNQRNSLLNAVTRETNTLKFLERKYNIKKEEFESLKEEFNTGNAILSALKKQVGDIGKRIIEIEGHILKHQNIVTALERDVENYSNVRESLASKAEEVTLLKITAQQASRSGLDILYKAEINPEKVAPSRSKIVIGATFIVFLLLCGFFVLKDLMNSDNESTTVQVSAD